MTTEPCSIPRQKRHDDEERSENDERQRGASSLLLLRWRLLLLCALRAMMIIGAFSGHVNYPMSGKSPEHKENKDARNRDVQPCGKGEARDAPVRGKPAG